ncbi:MAG TPA: ABC transporter permease [Actinomycetota bacterium]|jgi:putative spermidine/putrescine transport system permease protein|nr:ABC transporter permease [Actinomycetota bacterium]
MATLTEERQATGDPGIGRRVSAALFRHPRGKLALMLAPPLGWLVLVYLVALALLLLTSFWRLNVLTSQIEHVWSLSNYQTLVQGSVYRTIVLRTVGIAAAVTLTDLTLAFPISYYAARLATPRVRALLLLAVVMPLWSNYLVRMFSWKILTAGGGPLESLLNVIGIHKSLAASNWAVWLTFCYLWLPFAILPVYAAMERVPTSLLEASSDLGGRGWMTFRRVVLPLILPGMVAASIFTFSLTLGDYITPVYVGKDFFIGNAIYNLVGLASNLPLAAAFAVIPMIIMAVYLTIARKLGAFEAL